MEPTVATREIEDLNKVFAGRMENLQEDFIEQLARELRRLDTKNGRVLNSSENKRFVASLKLRFDAAAEKSGLQNAFLELLPNFDKANENLKEVHKSLSNIKLSDAFLEEFKLWGRETLLYDMQGQGLDAKVVQPLRQIITTSMFTGGDILDTIESLEDYLGENDRLARYYTQIARDSTFQYSGAINQAIANEYDLDGLIYVGSLVEDSRKQCQRWVEKETIRLADLPSEIAWAFKYGSGMILGTNENNFLNLRGGYNCRHEAYPIRLGDAAT